jgi:ribonuclease HII
MYPRVGIDEVGRGPLAGPVTVCALYLSRDISFFSSRIKDSKQLNPQKRREIYQRLLLLKKQGIINWSVKSKSARYIDIHGISHAIHRLINETLHAVQATTTTPILLDGGLRASKEYTNQQTIVRGDAHEEVIALASIIAKVTRDRYMTGIALRYPLYAFDEHKGYGTDCHYKALRKHGPSPLHRRTFLPQKN